jgi:catechol-2,3-dioxygenase
MKPPTITRIAEIVLSVRSIPKMRKFYTELLGFRLHKEASYSSDGEIVPDGEPTITFLAIKELDTPLGRNGHPPALALIDFQRHSSGRPGHDSTTSTLHHLAFEIPPESYETHLQYLTSLNLKPRKVSFSTAESLFIKDPEGNSIELICHAS